MSKTRHTAAPVVYSQPAESNYKVYIYRAHIQNVVKVYILVQIFIIINFSLLVVSCQYILTNFGPTEYTNLTPARSRHSHKVYTNFFYTYKLTNNHVDMTNLYKLYSD
jgi:hypothetical protein